MKVLPATPRSYIITHCMICNKKLKGRRDKKFCYLHCKNAYRDKRSAENRIATDETDRKLHRNRTILAELHQESAAVKCITPRNRLVRKGFAFDHFTSLIINKEGKTYLHIYDFSWMEFSSTDVLIVKKRSAKKTRRITT